MAVSPTTKLREFLPYVLPKAPGCPDFFALFNLRQAAIDFCEQTRCWRDVLTFAVTQTTTTIPEPNYCTIHEFEEVWHNGRKLEPVTFAGADPVELTGAVKAGSPATYSQPSQGLISIYPFQAGTIRMTVFLKPRQGQLFGVDLTDPLADAFDVVPPFMLQHNAKAIAAGALSMILSTPNETFTDSASAAAYAQIFSQAAAAAGSQKLAGQQRAPIRTKANWF